jgi:hypothetical protein
MTCPHCRQPGLVEIDILLRGRHFVMHSCAVCEKRWWENEGETVELSRVLSLVAAG